MRAGPHRCPKRSVRSRGQVLYASPVHIIHGPIRGKRIDAASLGTAHIAISRNNDIGGQTWSAIYLDGLMDRITMELDGRCVLREGKLLP